ncbi:Type 4 prepilin-like proteins leader peptide-processing enzyme [Streptomyces hundungensis]|uniref:Type 4 prepilin-like proteins leader peptide-processing enzyme n=1 Tax=Streptomyces hundungensis TaxID=1077946 RepID=A0A387HBH6_9ACTN|nr:A24 family peptidase [Streptomyces hundungensis]AYG77988.1 Type 4 prepilin-like proteins leader peptide-processing enzyme [Streptomyces hundungensis]
MLVTLACAYGALAGLLVPRAVYKLAVPADESWRSRCPAGHPAQAWLGLPRCKHCATEQAPMLRARRWYGPPAPAVALITILGCGALAHRTGPRPELAVWLLLTPILVLLTWIDVTVHRLPDILTLPLTPATLLLLGAAALFPNTGGSWPAALGGALALGGGYFTLFLISPRSLGFGDVKLAAALGAILGWYGWRALALGALAGPLIAAAYSLGLIALRKAHAHTAIPYGPFLISGSVVAIITR